MTEKPVQGGIVEYLQSRFEMVRLVYENLVPVKQRPEGKLVFSDGNYLVCIGTQSLGAGQASLG